MIGCRPEPGEKITLLRPAVFAMVTSYSLGSFNENFFKEAAMLIAVAEGKAYLQGYATILFTLPFLIFAAPAGWLADRFSKRRVMIFAKLVEVFAMSLGAIGLYYNNWNLVLFMAIIMSFQATTFSPSINGSIPEIFPPDYVTRANAVLKVSTMVCILVGVAVAGIALSGVSPGKCPNVIAHNSTEALGKSKRICNIHLLTERFSELKFSIIEGAL